ncbi:MAG TPA: peptide chain release factor-like protein [Myxococcota bacterium]|nr:peptide chain release factor-like protein [Myxococcota bacterium]HQK49839.1 peptide chain release factor-like protein [Myxococcota bacterium]
MGTFPVRPEKEQALRERMDRLGIREEDLEETFVRSAGPGGQKVNKTSSCVQIVHRPTGRLVKCQESRSQGLNRFRAREILVEAIEDQVLGEQSARRQEAERIRRQKRRRSRRAREKMLEGKRARGEVKALRRPPSAED